MADQFNARSLVAGDMKLIPEQRVSEVADFNQEAISWTLIKSLIPTIRALSELHGDFANVKSNIIRLCNTGHSFSIVAPSKEDLYKAQTALNAFLTDVHPTLGGIHGTINLMLSQLATDGAVSVESEAEFETNIFGETYPIRIAAIHQVDVRTIELIYEAEYFGHTPYQIVDMGKEPLRLPEATYQLNVFKPLLEPSPPYPVPPMIAGIPEARRQRSAISSIDRALSKAGVLGMLDATIERPEMYDGETVEQYEERLHTILNDVVTMLGQSISKGVYAHYGALGFKFTNFGAEFANALPFLDNLQYRMGRALQNDWSSDEKARASAFLSIIYEKTLNEMVHYQHLVTTPVEKAAKYDLAFKSLVQNFTVYDVSMSLDKDSVRYWENELVKTEVANKLVALGMKPEAALRYIGHEQDEHQLIIPESEKNQEHDDKSSESASPGAITTEMRHEMCQRLQFLEKTTKNGVNGHLYQGIFVYDPKNRHHRSTMAYDLAGITPFSLGDL
jgi:hypothetical protein